MDPNDVRISPSPERQSTYVLRSASQKDRRYSNTTASVPLSPQLRSSTLLSPVTPITPMTPSTGRLDSYFPRSKKQNPIISLYMSLSWIAGFRENYSLLLFTIFAGGLLGFCLARSLLMDPVKMRNLTVPGEFLWFDMPLYKINYIIHIYLTLIGGIFVGPQFLPTIRRRYTILHRLNGYLVLATLIVGNVCGGIISRRSFGGEINAQSAYYIMALMTIFSLIIGYFNVKRNTRRHRKWMLRAVVYFSTVISARLIMLCSRLIISNIGTYYSLWRCDEVLYVLQDLTQLNTSFPQCLLANNILSNPNAYVSVHASLNEGTLGKASAVRVVQGMSLWIATLIHVAGVELYLQLSENANYQRYGFALEPRGLDPEKDEFLRLHSY